MNHGILRENPEVALSDPFFATEKGLRLYLDCFGEWTYGMSDKLLTVAGDVAVELVKGQSPSRQAKGLLSRGSVHHRLGEHSRAMADYLAAMDQQIRLTERDPVLLSETYRYIGYSNHERQLWREADHAHMTAVDLVERKQRRYRALAYQGWGGSKLVEAMATGEQFLKAANLLRTGIALLEADQTFYKLIALTNLTTSEMMLGFPKDRLEETFLALQQARGKRTDRTKLSWGLKIHHVQDCDMDLRLCWAQGHLILREGNFKGAADGFSQVRQGFQRLEMHHTAAEAALDECLACALADLWDQASSLPAVCRKAALPIHEGLSSAISARAVEHIAEELAEYARPSKSPALVAAGLQEIAV